ncbi:MAG: alpha/beta fold hydrolase, partial [Acidimicrobiia bacterium]
METEAEVLIGEATARDVDHNTVLDLCSRVTSPVLVIHGDDDRISPLSRGRRLAEATGGSLITVEDGGHIALARDPVVVNQLIREFAGRISAPIGRPIRWPRGLNRRKRVLYVSSPIGLGHARRDVAIAKELKKLRPDLEIDWLAQDPVTRVLEAEGETIHPASEWLASESAHFASEATGHDLHCFQALRRMDEILVANFMIFQEVMEDGLYDLSLGDEAWDIDHFWHENPELKRGDHVWMTDFVGFLPMPSGGSHEEYLTADYNAEMIEHIARYPRIRDLALFVGSPDDIVSETFGAGLPKIRDWTEEHFQFTGYITGFEPPSDDQKAAWRSQLGYGVDEKVCLVTVG